MSSARRLLLTCSVIAAALIGPAVASAQAQPTGLKLIGKSKGVASTDLSTNPSPTTVFTSGHLARLGAFVAIDNLSFTPTGGSPAIPYRLTGTETLVFANGDQVFGDVNGTGVNNNGATSGTDIITVTGGTGRFAFASGSYTVTYTGHIFGPIGTSMVGPLTATIGGHIQPGGYMDPLSRANHLWRHRR